LRLRILGAGSACSERADADGAVGVETEDFVKGKNDCRCRRDDGTADDGHLPLINVAAPDGEAAVDDGGDAEDEAEHHNHGKTVADAGLEVGGTEPGALSLSRQDVQGKQGGHGEERTQPRTDFRNEYFFHGIVCALSYFYFGWQHMPPITRTVLAPPKTGFV
jgi:hypothetical protein